MSTLVVWGHQLISVLIFLSVPHSLGPNWSWKQGWPRFCASRRTMKMAWRAGWGIWDVTSYQLECPVRSHASEHWGCFWALGLVFWRPRWRRVGDADSKFRTLGITATWKPIAVVFQFQLPHWYVCGRVLHVNWPTHQKFDRIKPSQSLRCPPFTKPCAGLKATSSVYVHNSGTFGPESISTSRRRAGMC